MHVLSRFTSDPLLKHNVVFFFGSLSVAVLNYLYHPVISRLVSVEAFGEVLTIFSLMSQVAIFMGVFNMVSIHLTANEKREEGRDLLEEVYTLVFALILAVSLAILLGAPFLAARLQFESVLPFVFLAAILSTGVPLSLQNSRLQGQKNFLKLSYSSFILSGGKLLFSAALVVLGAGVLGAIGGIIVAQLVTLWYISNFDFTSVRILPHTRPRFDRVLSRELAFAVIALFSGITVILSTLDTVAVKYFFPPEAAGLYGGIAIIARIIFFLTASVAGVLLPSITLKQTRRENYTALKKSALLVFLIGGGALIVMIAAPELVIRTLIGAKYLPLAALLPKVALMVFATSCVNMLVIFLMALRRYALIPMSIAALVLLFVLLAVSHHTVSDVVNAFLVTNCALVALLLMYLAYDYRVRA